MSEIKGIKKAVKRILEAVKRREKIILYGDADPDGVTSVIILKEALSTLGGEVSAVYFPDRELEGYGITEKALNFLKFQAPALFIALDCGTTNVKEVELAKRLGFEVIIIDHHEVLPRLSKAKIIINPKQKTDKYPFKELATAGIVFKLVLALLGKGISQSLKNSFLELAMLATIGDMMPEAGENQEIIRKGLESLEKTWRPGLRVFWEINSIKNYGQTRQVAQKIVSSLNSAQTKDHLNESYLLLTSKDLKEARELAKNLLEKSYQRQLRIKEIYQEVETRILKNIDCPIIFEGDFDWKLVLIGPVASKICHQFKKPTFLFSKREKESQGAVRVPEGLNGVKAMMNCRQFLETFGGHPLAAGFRIKNENLEKFKNCLINFFQTLKKRDR